MSRGSRENGVSSDVLQDTYTLIENRWPESVRGVEYVSEKLGLSEEKAEIAIGALLGDEILEEEEDGFKVKEKPDYAKREDYGPWVKGSESRDVTTINPDFRDDVYEAVVRVWPTALDVTNVSNKVDAPREPTRLALLDLFRKGKVSDTAKWNYRATLTIESELLEEYRPDL